MIDGHDVDDPSHKETVDKVEAILQAEKEKMQSSSMSQFWLQYMTMVDILKKYLKAERLGNWKMQDMLPYFAASGHAHYLK